jgi:Outer membrane protein beta-barrel domain
MTDKLFDSFIRDKMGDHVAEVPSGAWDRIAAARDKRRKKPQFPIKYWALLLLPILAGGAWLMFRQPQQTGANTPGSSSSNSSLIAGNKEATSPVNNNTSPSGSTTADPAATPLPGNSTNNNQLIDQNNTNNSTPVKNNSSTLTANNNNAVTPSGSISAGSRIRNNQRTTNNPSGRRNNPDRDQFISPAETPPVNTIRDQAPKQQVTTPPERGRDRTGSGINDIGQSANRQPLLTPVELLPYSSAYGKNDQLNNNKLSPIRLPEKCPSLSGPPRNDWYLEVYASPDYSFKKVSPPDRFNPFLDTSNVLPRYLAQKNDAESFRGAFSAGINISKSLSENWLLRTGVRYGQVNERFNYRNENERRLITVITERTIIRGPGDTLIVRDTSVVEQFGARVKTTYNRYRSIDIPVLMSYEFGRDNWKFNVTGGVIVNLRSWYKGAVLDTSYLPLTFTSKKGNDIYKSNIGLGFYGSFRVLRSINEHLEFYAEPYFRFNPSEMTTGRSPFKQTIQNAGLQFGIRYRLKGRSGQRDR